MEKGMILSDSEVTKLLRALYHAADEMHMTETVKCGEMRDGEMVVCELCEAISILKG